MILTGASMKGNTYVMGFCFALICSIGFSENKILWDLGVVIRQSEIQNTNNEISHKFPSKDKISQTKITAVIADPFVPPTRNTNTSKISGKFLSEPIDAEIVRTTLIIINNVAVAAVNLESKLADPRADIIPPMPPDPPPSPKPSLSEPCKSTKKTKRTARIN